MLNKITRGAAVLLWIPVNDKITFCHQYHHMASKRASCVYIGYPPKKKHLMTSLYLFTQLKHEIRRHGRLEVFAIKGIVSRSREHKSTLVVLLPTCLAAL